MPAEDETPQAGAMFVVDTEYFPATESRIVSSTPTAGIRRVLRNGTEVLQQAWQATEQRGGSPVRWWVDWRDVPLVDEVTGLPFQAPSQT